LVLLSLFSASALLMPASIQPPPQIAYPALVFGIAGLVAAVGLWQQKRWGWILAIVDATLSMLLAAPGIVLAPDGGPKAVSWALIALYALVLVLLALPATRKAVA
jgi:uncharacterized membrane protein (DUF2068 family)